MFKIQGIKRPTEEGKKAPESTLRGKMTTTTQEVENGGCPPICVLVDGNRVERTYAFAGAPSTATSTEQPVGDLSATELLSGIPEDAIEMRGAVLLIDLSACPEKVAELFNERFSIPIAPQAIKKQEASEEWGSPLLPGMEEFLGCTDVENEEKSIEAIKQASRLEGE